MVDIFLIVPLRRFLILQCQSNELYVSNYSGEFCVWESLYCHSNLITRNILILMIDITVFMCLSWMPFISKVNLADIWHVTRSRLIKHKLLVYAPSACNAHGVNMHQIMRNKNLWHNVLPKSHVFSKKGGNGNERQLPDHYNIKGRVLRATSTWFRSLIRK